MTSITKKNFLYKLIICIFIVLALINIGTPQKAFAKEEEAGVGGKLLSPIGDLIQGLGDAIMNIMQNSIMGTDATLALDNTKSVNWGRILLGLILIVLAVVAICVTGGGAAALLPIIGKAVAAVAIALGATVMTGTTDEVVGIISAVASEVFTDTVVLPTYTIGPQEIFSGRILLFDANVFKPKQVYVEYNSIDAESDTTGPTMTTTLENWNELKSGGNYQATKYYYNEDGKQIPTSVNNSSYELRNIISEWYYIIRNIALVGSIIVLLYVGIRMTISSIAEEKAKYKQMLADWLVAMCLIVLMHYIMAFSHNIVENVIKLCTSFVGENIDVALISEPGDKLVEGIKELENSSGMTYLYEGDTLVKWPTNQMGRFRIEAQNRDGNVGYIGYSIAYFVLVLFTLVFAFTYIKRLLYLLFLTVISPLVALTYPIDKINDGKAQAFNIWFKEYIFNLLIQPFHFLLYTIFVAMAYELAGTNVIYSLVVLGFMIPAEKFLRKMFGFDKASTPGLFAGAAGAALTMSAVQSLSKFAKGGHGPSAGNKNNKDDANNNNKIRTADSNHSQQSLFEDAVNEGNRNPNLEETGSTDDEKLRLASERKILDEFEAEGAESENWTDEDYAAFDELEKEQLEKEAKFAQEQEEAAQQELSELDTQQPIQIEEPKSRSDDIRRALDRVAFSPVGRFTSATAKGIWGGAKEQFKELPGQTLRLGANAASAVTLGSIGLAAGIVSGDAGTAFKNTTAAAATGVALSSGTINRLEAQARSNKGANEQWKKDFYGADYEKKLREKQDEKFKKDKEIREMYAQKLQLSRKEDIDKAMDAAKKYREYGINDNSVIIKAMKLENGNSQNWDDKKRIAAAKLAEASKSEKDLETNMKRFAKVPKVTEKQVKEMEARVRKINNL